MARGDPSITSFNGGEFSPWMRGRPDMEKYSSGCEILINAIPRVAGPAVMRPGTQYMGTAKGLGATMLKEFEASTSANTVLELGSLYMRFWDAATRLRIKDNAGSWGPFVAGTTPAELVTPWTTIYDPADVTPRVQMAQSNDVAWMVHPLHFPQKLSRIAQYKFSLAAMGDGVHAPVPFKDLNPNNGIGMRVTGTGGVGITLIAGGAVFAASSVGEYWYIEQPQADIVVPWEVKKAVTTGDVRRSDGRNYLAGTTADTGTVRPTHSASTKSDGGVYWTWLDDGYGVVLITAVTTGAATKAITGAVNNGSGAIRLTVTAHGLGTGYYGTVASVGGVSAANGNWVLSVIDANTIDLYGSTFSGTYTSGGTIKIADNSQATASVVLGLPYSLLTTYTTRFARQAWNVDDGYPAAVAFFAERLCFARGQTVWCSVAGDYENFQVKDGGIVTDDLAITLTVGSQKNDRIRWLAGMTSLIAGTANGEYKIEELNSSDPFSPSNVKAKPISGYGSFGVQPLKVGEAVLFVQSGGRRLREIVYDIAVDNYKANDLTRYAEHLPPPFGFTQMVAARQPDPVVWLCGGGRLRSMTYERSENVFAWARHALAGLGTFSNEFGGVDLVCGAISLAVTRSPDGVNDDLWMVVSRFQGGSQINSIEIIGPAEKVDTTGLYYAYTETPNTANVNTIDFGAKSNVTASATALAAAHIPDGQSALAILDGVSQPAGTITSGALTVAPAAGTRYGRVGFAYTCTVKPMALHGSSSLGAPEGKVARVSGFTARVYNTVGFYYGADENTKIDFKTTRRLSDVGGVATPLRSGDYKVRPEKGSTGIDDSSPPTVIVQQISPMPLCLLSIFPQLTVQDT